MKNLKVNLGALALLLGISAASFGAIHRSADHKWGLQSNGEYIEVTGQSQGPDYRCTGDENVCTETYPEGVDPNDQDNDTFPGVAEPTAIVSGNFSN
jgi:hypothetical protein